MRLILFAFVVLVLFKQNSYAQNTSTILRSSRDPQSYYSGVDYDNTFDHIVYVELNNTVRASSDDTQEALDVNSGVSLSTKIDMRIKSDYQMIVKIKGGWTPNPEYNVKAWFDWNADGIYSQISEEVDFGWQPCDNGGGDPMLYTFSAKVSVPASSIMGNTRMRVGLDYFRLGADISSNNQRSGALSGGYSTIANLFIGNRVGDFEDYQIVLFPSNVTSCPIGTLRSLRDPLSPYGMGDYDNLYDHIVSVNLNGVTRASANDAQEALDVNSAISLATQMNVRADSVYKLQVKIKGGWTPNPEYNVKAWFDWNADGFFNIPEEEVDLGWQSCDNGGGAPMIFDFYATIVVPSNAIVGNTRLRIGLDYYRLNAGAFPNNQRSGALSCGYSDIANLFVGNRVGDFEDYTLNISPSLSPPAVVGGNTNAGSGGRSGAVDSRLILETLNSNIDTKVVGDANSSTLKFLVMDEEKATGTKIFVWQQTDNINNPSQLNNDIFCMIYDKNMIPKLTDPVRVNSYSTNDQSTPSVLMNQIDNSAYISWSSNHNGNYDVYVKKVSLNNIDVDIQAKNEHLVNTNYTNNRQTNPLMTYDYIMNELIIGWTDLDGQDGSGYGGYARRVKYESESGFTFPEAQFRINEKVNDNQNLSGIAVNSVTGELYTVSQSVGYSLDQSYDIIFRKFVRSVSGHYIGQGQVESVINSNTAGLQANPVITINNNTGDYAISWTNWDISITPHLIKIYSRIFDKYNNEVKADFMINIADYPYGNRLYPKAIWDYSSGGLVYFYNFYKLGFSTIKYQIYNEDFMPVGEEEEAVDGININSGFGWSHSVNYNQQNKKVFLCYDVRAVEQGDNSAGWFRQLGYVNPVSNHDPDFANLNFVQEDVILSPLSNPEYISNLTTEQIVTTRTYFDGLGRPMQEVRYKGSPNKKDIIMPIQYDAAGREVKSYLPYTSESADGSYRVNALIQSGYGGYVASEQWQFYNNLSMNNIDHVVNELYPFAEKKYENDIPNRLMETGSLGYSGLLGQGHINIVSNNIGYATDNVRVWTFDGVTATSTTTYPNFSLVKSTEVDEMGKTTEVFNDHLGRKILVRDIPVGCITNSCHRETYYVYDDLDNVRLVITPEAISQMALSGTWSVSYLGSSNIDKMIYGYKYDKRQRIIEKLIPGKSVVFVVYDELDRPIFSQDGNQRISNQWAFVKYDPLGREILTGITIDKRSRSTIQADVTNFSTFEQVDNSRTSGYTNTAFPNISDSDVLRINYYDDYSNSSIPNTYTSAGFSAEPILAMTNFNRLTGYKLRNLTGNNWLRTILTYDIYGNVVQKRTNNHKNYAMVGLTSSQYSFSGQLLVERELTSTYKDVLVTHKRYEYDHAGRLKQVFQKNGTDEEFILANYRYNEIGQLIEKNIHSDNQGVTFLQSIDYTYNVKGYLTHINNSTLSNSNMLSANADNNNDIDDLFGLELAYDNVLSDVSNTPMYNGMISGMKFMVKNPYTTTSERAYKYTYDDFYRLSDAVFAIQSLSSFDFSNNSCRESLTYDKNSNIKTLIRYGLPLSGSTSIKVDDLVYNYANSGNQLTNIEDLSDEASFFNGRHPSGIAYSYDANGNLIQDLNKGIFNISYNHLNLPTRVAFTSDGKNYITYGYDASGKMLSKTIFKNGTLYKVFDYVESMYYEDDAFVYYNTPEGRAYLLSSGKFRYLYDLKDHLGNVRITVDEDPATGRAYIVQEDNYYAFGARINGLSYRSSGIVGINNFLFGKKEYQEGLNTTGGVTNNYDWDVYDFGARFYDPTIGRFNTVDNHAELYNYVSPYVYCLNSPINHSDPTGNDPYDFMVQQQEAMDAMMTSFLAQAEAMTSMAMEQIQISANYAMESLQSSVFSSNYLNTIAEADAIVAYTAFKIDAAIYMSNAYGSYYGYNAVSSISNTSNVFIPGDSPGPSYTKAQGPIDFYVDSYRESQMQRDLQAIRDVTIDVFYRAPKQWLMNDNKNNGYILTGDGYGQEGGRNSVGLTHTIDIGFTRVFDPIKAGAMNWIEIGVNHLENINKLFDFYSDANGIRSMFNNGVIAPADSLTEGRLRYYYNSEGQYMRTLILGE